MLAQETGGIAMVNQNNFEKGLKRIDAETSDYYVVGYYSTNPGSAEADPQDRGQGPARGTERCGRGRRTRCGSRRRRPSSGAGAPPRVSAAPR